MKTNKNIVFFINNLNSGGIENYLLRFLKEKNNNFSKIYIYCKSGKDGQLENEYLKLKNIFIVKNKLNYINLMNYINLILFFKKNKINIICDFTGNFAGLTLLTAYISDIDKRVAFYRGSTDRFKKNILRNLYNTFVNFCVKKYSTNILSNSEAALNYFFHKKWQNNLKFKIIHNGINPDLFLLEKNNLRKELQIPEDAFVIGHTGRYNEAKNHKTIIATAEILIKKHHDIYFILCGNGVKENLQEILKEKRIDNKVLIFENRNDIPCFLNTMDCYFFPSTTEGQPNSLIEAMIMGLPFIASDIPAIRETVGDKYKLYPALNVDILASALEEQYLIKKSRDLIQQKETIQRFDYKKRFDEFLEILIN